MYVRAEYVTGIRQKPITCETSEDKLKKIYHKTIVLYGRNLITIQLFSEKPENLEIKDYVKGEKSTRKKLYTIGTTSSSTI